MGEQGQLAAKKNLFRRGGLRDRQGGLHRAHRGESRLPLYLVGQVRRLLAHQE